jgi:hypothetical protein
MNYLNKIKITIDKVLADYSVDAVLNNAGYGLVFFRCSCKIEFYKIKILYLIFTAI